MGAMNALYSTYLALMYVVCLSLVLVIKNCLSVSQRELRNKFCWDSATSTAGISVMEVRLLHRRGALTLLTVYRLTY